MFRVKSGSQALPLYAAAVHDSVPPPLCLLQVCVVQLEVSRVMDENYSISFIKTAHHKQEVLLRNLAARAHLHSTVVHRIRPTLMTGKVRIWQLMYDFIYLIDLDQGRFSRITTTYLTEF